MATGDRNSKQKATDIVRHYSDTTDGGIPVCGTKNYGYSTTHREDVSCIKCKNRMISENNILNQTELFRVTYDWGYYIRFMVQKDKSGSAFYYILKGTYNLCPVETSNEDINVIIAHVEKCINIYQDALSTIDDLQIREVHKHCILKEKELLEKLKSHTPA